jgi:hypothetical protein
MIDLMDFCAILIGFFNFFLYTTAVSSRGLEYDRRIIGVVIANIVIGGVFAVFPWKALISRFYN